MAGIGSRPGHHEVPQGAKGASAGDSYGSGARLSLSGTCSVAKVQKELAGDIMEGEGVKAIQLHISGNTLDLLGSDLYPHTYACGRWPTT